MSDDLWNRYMSPHVTPEEYKAQGGDLAERLKSDLTELWGHHPSSSSLKPDEINTIAANLAYWLKTGRTNALEALDDVLSEEGIALDKWTEENKRRRRGGW